jgi:hypothetical protein
MAPSRLAERLLAGAILRPLASTTVRWRTMTLDLTPALIFFLAVFIVAAVLRLGRNRTSRSSGPFPDVPDASPTAKPIDAPGLTADYSSLDPFAPPKHLTERTDVRGAPDSH